MDESRYVEDLIDQEDNFDRWYVEVVQKAGLADDAPVRGCKVIRPYGYGLWELMVARLDARIKATGVENAYFPLFIPRSMLEREADHIEGFAPEVAWVTRGGERELEEPWAVRPTSEAIICPSYARWVQSYRDLPILINQWGNAVRWEERPRAFLRTLEFLWQEGHTCHATRRRGGRARAADAGGLPAFFEEDLAIPVVPGLKTESEKFAGALRTHTDRGDDGRQVLGAAGRDFARPGRSLRPGVRHPFSRPRWRAQAGLQHVVRAEPPRRRRDGHGPRRRRGVEAAADRGAGAGDRRSRSGERTTSWRRWRRPSTAITERLAPVARVRVDWRDERTPGYKFNEWELKGVPLRLEVGPARRGRRPGDGRPARHAREACRAAGRPWRRQSRQLLGEMQKDLFAAAKQMLDEHTAEVESLRGTCRRGLPANAGWSLAHWCGDAACEARVKAETKATIRCIPVQPADCV